MMKLTKSIQVNGKSLSKAKSADEPLTTTKPCGHEGTLDGGNNKPLMEGKTSNTQEFQTSDAGDDLELWERQTSEAGNAKPRTPGTTSEARNAIPRNAKPRKPARNAKPTMLGTTSEARNAKLWRLAMPNLGDWGRQTSDTGLLPLGHRPLRH